MAVNVLQHFLATRKSSALRWGHCAFVATFLAFGGSALAGGGDALLRNTYWKLTYLGDTPSQTTARLQEAHLIFAAHELRVSGSSGCNRIMGGFRLDGDNLHVSQMVATRMACLDGMEQEQLFLKSLNDVAHYRIKGDQLELLDRSGKIIARFVAMALR